MGVRPDFFALRRTKAHAVILTAAALVTALVAALAVTLVLFSDQALPRAALYDLSAAPGTALAVSGTTVESQFASDTSRLSHDVSAALHGARFRISGARWSDPLGLVKGALPQPPTRSGQSDVPLAEAAALSSIAGNAALISGQWPQPPQPGQPVQAALPATTAAALHLTVGDLLRFRDRVTGRPAEFRLTGIFTPVHHARSYWEVDTIPASGSASVGGFTTYGPLVVNPAVFDAGTLATSSASWVVEPDTNDFSGQDLGAIAADVTTLGTTITNDGTLQGMQLTTSLPTVLDDTAADASVARSLLVIGAIQLLLLAAATLLAVARLLTSQRETETALLIARGATRRQLVWLTATEVVPLCTAAAVGGAIGGVYLADVLTGVGPLRPAHLSLPGLGGTTLGDMLLTVAATTLVATALLLLPVLRTVMPGPARAERARQAALAGAVRAGADIGLIVLAVIAGWQLRRYSAAPTSATSSLDPVLAVAPALALAGGTLVVLRLLPIGARIGDRLAARGRGLTTPLANWQFSRQPVRQGGTALLLVMAAATGTLALSQHSSWIRSASDQAAFAAGATLRADTPEQLSVAQVQRLIKAPGIADAMAVSVQAPANTLAIDASQAQKVALIRPDEATEPATRLFHMISPPALTGITLLGPSLTVKATLSKSPVPPMNLLATVMDNHGNGSQFSLGSLPADGRQHTLTVPLGVPDCRLIGLSAEYQLPPSPGFQAGLTLSITGSDDPRLSGWQAKVSSPELNSLEGSPGQLTAYETPSSPGLTGNSLSFSSGFGQSITNGLSGPSYEPLFGEIDFTQSGTTPLTTLPGIATDSYLTSNSLHVGSIVQDTLNGVAVPVRIMASMHEFPTVTSSGGALIVDLRSVQEYLARHIASPVPVTEWWLSQGDPPRAAGLMAALPPGSVLTTQAGLAAAITRDPVSVAPQQALLATAGAAALLAIAGFIVAIASDVRQRRGETALLAALGVGSRSAAWQFCLEKLLLSLPAALLGLLLGTVLARLLVPAVTLTTAATTPVPPPLTAFDLIQAVPLAVAIAALPAIAAAVALLRRPDPAAELRAAEAG